LAEAAALSGQAASAVRLWGAAAGLRAALGTPLPPTERGRHERAVTASRVALGQAAFAAAWDAGRVLPLGQAVAEALALVVDPSAGTDAVPASAPGARHGLTPREVEVLRLVVEGRSDREIAATLFVSRHTAANHVASILAKLELPSRAAAAGYAVRHGLA
jgi:DNA-binding CsgD family transcriptional regulator